MCERHLKAHVVLFHSALGLRPAVTDFAHALRERGHHVVTPDYYEGRIFDSEPAGIAFRDGIGVPNLMRTAREALIDVPDDAVLAGFSLGAFFAQAFAAKRPDARAVVLLHNVESPRGRSWNGVPVQVHRYARDPWIDERNVADLREAVEHSGTRFDDRVVSGEGHLFTDLATPDGDPAALAASIEAFDAFIR